MVTLSERVLSQYRRFSLYNSPYTAHDTGSAIDLYPDADATTVPSPVTGTVALTRTVQAPPKPYAEREDYLIVVDTGDQLVRIMHVDPSVEPGDRVSIGDSLGRPVRAGFFAPWVDNHLHVGIRPRDADPVRASGSLPIEPAVDVEALAWDGRGTVVERGETYAVLDEPAHPAPGEYFVGLGTLDGQAVLDGGLPHYDCGGLIGAGTSGHTDREPVELAGSQVGVATGRDVTWDDVTVLANGEPITGIALFADRERFGAKLICPDAVFQRGERVRVRIE
ncbi:hypothetical protein [Natranaeroarchaeum aerophilus]|uniref:Uncharacterized protein n=1 Tax=Natranaeroarchaeum aerophilus TaxID=2917711 RepID=A0AAE3FTP9_9EURY|nr:hypothetical protein [Natranaeroarchaeum aerophilus]MCL9814743.1 hypothetical protein [Natranaeroarchaeum aerophilus]